MFIPEPSYYFLSFISIKACHSQACNWSFKNLSFGDTRLRFIDLTKKLSSKTSSTRQRPLVVGEPRPLQAAWLPLCKNAGRFIDINFQDITSSSDYPSTDGRLQHPAAPTTNPKYSLFLFPALHTKNHKYRFSRIVAAQIHEGHLYTVFSWSSRTREYQTTRTSPGQYKLSTDTMET